MSNAKEKIKEIATKEQKDAMKEMFRMVDKSKVDEVKQMLEYTQKGTAKATVGNYMVVLRNDPLVRESMKYNKLTGRIDIVKKLWWNEEVCKLDDDAIKKIAANESCVIVGRCADYALADEPHCLNIFIRSNMDDRIKRISERLNVPENKAKDIIKKKDKERSSYYNYYTSKKWGDARSYDLCLNTSQISVEDSIELILKYRECMRSHNK